MSDEWLSLREVADMFGVHVNTIKRTPPSTLPFLRIGERGDRRYRRTDVEDMIERRMVRQDPSQEEDPTMPELVKRAMDGDR
jgi:hypothetical protein